MIPVACPKCGEKFEYDHKSRDVKREPIVQYQDKATVISSFRVPCPKCGEVFSHTPTRLP